MQGKRKVIAKLSCPVSQITRANQCCGGRIGNGFIPASKLNDNVLSRLPRQWRLADKRRPCHRIARLRKPITTVLKYLDVNGPRYGIDHRRLVTQRHVVIKVEAANIDQRRYA